MEKFKVIDIQKRIFENNDKEAELIRKDLKASKTFVINLMSSPGSGKTTMLVETIKRIKSQLKIAIIEADIDSDVDAITISNTGVTVTQLHSGGMCHLDAGMAKIGLDAVNAENYDFVVIENIGNLICPAGYDLGQSKKVMLLSVPEGDDKPLKYPKMFSKTDVLVITKIDALSIFSFDFEALETRVKALNPNIEIFAISAKTGEGMDDWCNYLLSETKKWKEIGENRHD